MGKYHVIPGGDGVWRTDEAGEGTDMPRGSVLDGIATEGLNEELVFGGKGREGSWNIWKCHTQKDLSWSMPGESWGKSSEQRTF